MEKKSTIQNNNVYHLNFILKDVWIHESKIIIIPKKHIHLWEMILFFSKSPNGWFEGDNSILFLCVLSTMLCFHILLFYCSRQTKHHWRKKKQSYCSDPYKNYTKCKLQNRVQMQNALLFLKGHWKRILIYLSPQSILHFVFKRLC